MAKDFAIKFYKSATWQRCRTAYAQSVFGLCERCGQPGDEVHHKVYLTPNNINDPAIALSWDNLELLCHECHTREHMSKYSATRDDVMFDEYGNLVPRESAGYPPIRQKGNRCSDTEWPTYKQRTGFARDPPTMKRGDICG